MHIKRATASKCYSRRNISKQNVRMAAGQPCLDNAIKHSRPGGVVEIGMTHRNQHYEISVIDAGERIPPAIQERIFERFFRADVARAADENPTASGAGLGLAIARKIVQLHGGRLEVAESRPGRTELRVTLSASQPNAPELG